MALPQTRSQALSSCRAAREHVAPFSGPESGSRIARALKSRFFPLAWSLAKSGCLGTLS
jgi:hypothetical protein